SRSKRSRQSSTSYRLPASSWQFGSRAAVFSGARADGLRARGRRSSRPVIHTVVRCQVTNRCATMTV
ncbi:MAG: hypothetical protein ACJA0V_004112, partial [Planctomycetota bacterium]